MSSRKEKCPAIGIDLGTTNSCVGVWQNGRIEIIANEQNNRTTPSCVAFSDNERFIGDAAENQRRMNPANTIFDAKRLIGRTFYDDMVQEDMKLWPFKVIPGPQFGDDQKPLVLVSYKGQEKQFSAEEISAMVLIKMKDIAEAYLDVSVKDVVVTVPAYFNDSQRQATKDACSIAKLNVLRIINEPTAAAIAYGFEKKLSSNDTSKKNVLVFDLGGGTFDVSLVAIEKEEFKVKAVGGDTHLGGSDFDNRLVNRLVEDFKKKHNKDLSQNPRALGKLKASCEKAKKTLSIMIEANIELDSILDGIDLCMTISRARFESLNIDLFQKCMGIVEQCLIDAHIGKSDVDDIFLVGGSTRIPKVQQLLQEFFDGKELLKILNPDEAVAYGAAVQAGILSGATNNEKDMVLVDVTPLSLGVKVGNGLMSVVIPKNATIPARGEKIFAAENVEELTYGDKEDRRTAATEIPVYEGERLKADDNNFLGVFELPVITSSTEPTTLINVSFEIDNNGILNVSAEETKLGNKSEITIINRSRLSKTDVDRMINEAEEYKTQDKKYEQMVKAKNTFEDYANDISGRLANYDRKFGEKNLTDAVQPILKWLARNSENVLDVDKYEEKQEELKRICAPYISSW